MEVKGKKFMVCVSGGVDGLAAAMRLHTDGGEVVALHNQSSSVTKLGDYYGWKVIKSILDKNHIKYLEVDVVVNLDGYGTHNNYTNVLLETLKSTLNDYPNHIWSTGARLDDRSRGDLEMGLEESGHPWYNPLTKYGTADSAIFEGIPRDLDVTLSSCDFGMWHIAHKWSVMCGPHSPRQNWCFKCHMTNRMVSLIELGLLTETPPEGVTLRRLGSTVVVLYDGNVIYTEYTSESLNELPLYTGGVVVVGLEDKEVEKKYKLTYERLMRLTENEACDSSLMSKRLCCALDVDTVKILCME